MRDALTRFPVLGNSQRHRQLYTLVRSLICARIADAVAQTVAHAWWSHWYAAGTARDEPNPARIG